MLATTRSLTASRGSNVASSRKQGLLQSIPASHTTLTPSLRHSSSAIVRVAAPSRIDTKDEQQRLESGDAFAELVALNNATKQAVNRPQKVGPANCGETTRSPSNC